MLGMGRVGQPVLSRQVMSFIALVTDPAPLLSRSFMSCLYRCRCLPALQSLAAHRCFMTSSIVCKAAHPRAPRLVSSSSSPSFCCGSSLVLGGPQECEWGTRWMTWTRSNCTRIGMRMVVISVKAITGSNCSTTDLNANQNRNQKQLCDEVQRYGTDDVSFDYTSTSLEWQQQPNSCSVGMKKKTGSGSSTAGKRKRSTVESRKRGRKQRKRQALTLEEESGLLKDWCAYLLLSAECKKTYVGVTRDIKRRLRQHNGELAGGAKSARAGRPWRLVCTVRGFSSRSEACRFEWSWKSTAANTKIVAQLDSKVESPLVTRRRATLAQILTSNEEWTYLNFEWHDK